MLTSLVRLRRRGRTWAQARATLLRSMDRYATLGGSDMWLSTQDLPLQLEFEKLVPRFVGPFPVQRVIGP